MNLKVGDTVKYTQPENDNEAAQRFVLIELNGDRCVIEFLCDWTFKPQHTVRTSDVCLVNDKE